MAMITCPECGKEYSNLAPACPNCGYPTSRIISPKNNSRPIIRSTKTITEIVDNGDSIIRKYKKLPTLAAIWCWLLLISNLIASFYRMVENSGDFPFVREFIATVLVIGLIVGLIAVINLKSWGLYLLLAVEICAILTSIIDGIVFSVFDATEFCLELVRIAIFLCILFFSKTEGYSAFTLILNNGVIEEKK